MPARYTAADHIDVLDLAVAQIPDAHRHGTPILVRTDGAGASKQWLAHVRSLRDTGGLDVQFSVGFSMAERVQAEILALPAQAGPGGRSRRPAAGRADVAS